MPVQQALIPHKTTHQNGGADEIDATGLDGVGGGSPQFDVDGTKLRLPSTANTIAQETSGGTDATIVMDTGNILITATGAEEASIELDGASGDVTILASATSSSDIELIADGNVTMSIGSGRVIMAGGIGVTFPALASDPTPVGNNLTYFNTTTDKLRCWDGAAWNDLF